MKYLAICLLSLAASFAARTAPLAGAEADAPIFAPARPVHIASLRGESTSDRALAGALAAVLVALQLRRRQKSFALPRPLN